MTTNGEPRLLPKHDWRVEIILQEDLNISTHLEPAGLLSKEVIEQGLASFLDFPSGVGLSVVRIEITGPLLAKVVKTGEDIVKGKVRLVGGMDE